jgi:quercetin dioxygenase-like cupin family protein
MRHAMATVGALAVVGIIAAVSAQQATFSRVVLQQVDISVPGREAVTALVTLPPGVTSGRHTHPGEEVGYVLEGPIVVEQDGKPAVTLETGKAFLIPAGTVHSATNKGTGTAKVLANYIVEKGKPIATPVGGAAKN